MVSERRAWITGLLLLLLLAGSGAAWSEEAAGQASRLVEFELADQFDRPYRSADYEGRPLVLIGSDRGGSSFNPQWGKAIEEALDDRSGGDRVAVIYLADLGGAPRLLRGFIKGKFPDDESYWILMDWKGLFDATYGLEKKNSNLLVFSPTGDLLLRHTGREVDSSVVEQAAEAVAPRAED